MSYNQDSPKIKFTPGKDSSYSSNDDVGTKPTGDPRSGKDFKKIMSKEGDKGQGQKKNTLSIADDDESDVAITDAPKQKGPVSLFDLAASKGLTDESADQDMQAANKLLSKLPNQKGDNVVADKLAGDAVTQGPNPTKEKFTTRFDTEQPDLSYVNPLATTASPINNVAPIQQKLVLPATNIQDIITQMTEHLSKMETDGRTDTTITLKYPPMFNGVNLIVSSFDTAKGEFNVAFENLTQAAKNILDMRINQESLRQALEHKGYAIHIVTTTTNIENPVIGAPEPSKRDQARDDQQQQGRQQRNQRNQEEA